MITENLSTLKIHKLTKAQYDRELAAGRIDENALYLTPDEESAIIYTQNEEPANAEDGTLWLDTDAVAAASPDLTLQTILDYVIANLPKAEEASI